MLSVHHGLRARNLALTLGSVAENSGAISRAGISARTGLNRSTAGRLVDELVRGRLVRELGATVSSHVGRPGTALALDPHGPAALGLDVAATHVTACVVDFAGGLRFQRSVPRDGGADHVARLAREALAAVDAAGLPLGGTAVAADEDVSWMAAQPLFGPHVVIDSAVNLAALAEDALVRARESFLYLGGRAGLEAALVLDGRLRPGRGALGPPADAAAELIRRACGPTTADAVAIREQAGAGHFATRAALMQAGAILGEAVAVHLALLDLDRVVLGGRYREVAQWLAPEVAAASAGGGRPGPLVVSPAARGAEAAARGAARAVAGAVIDDPLRWLTRR